MLITGLIIMGICIDLGASPKGDVIGFRYWKSPGVFGEYLVSGAAGRFTGFWSVTIGAAYSFAGIEQITVCASETKNPYTAIPRACKRVFFRVAFCYLASIFVVGLIVPWNNQDLLADDGTASTSPFVLAARLAGIRVLPSIANALIVTSAWSSGNHSAFTAARVLYGLALDRKAPQVFTKVSSRGIPYMAVCFVSLFMTMSFMTLSESATQVFAWLQSAVSACTLTSWAIIAYTSLRLHKGLRAQSIPITDLPWATTGQPYIAWIALLGSLLILITGGFASFLRIDGILNFSAEDFVSNYFNVPLIVICYVAWKLIKRTKVVGLKEMPIGYFIHRFRTSGIGNSTAESLTSFDDKPKSGLARAGYFLWG